MRFLGFIFILFLLNNCARAPLKEKSAALRVAAQVAIEDTLSSESLVLALRQNIKHMEGQDFLYLQLGPYQVSKLQMIQSQRELLEHIEKHGTSQISEIIRERFHFLEVYGQDSWGEVFVTSYFDPVISGSLKPTKTHTQALYRLPEDLVLIQLDQFSQRFPGLQERDEQKTLGSILRGRYIPGGKGKESFPPTIVPYFNRQEIDEDQALKGKKLEIVWVDPIDSFFLQIQGSGKVQLDSKKEMRVGYAGQNGYRYEAIGKFLKEKIPLEEMTMHTIEAHLRSLPPVETQKILNQNPSYVFFRRLDTKSITFMGSEVVPGRTIATDHRFFPKGTLAFLDVEVPVFEDPQSLKPSRFERKPRLVIDQDTGGAIRGGGRVDLYWGEGYEAKRSAGVMKQEGKLYYLIPRGSIPE